MPFETLEELKEALKDHDSLNDIVDFLTKSVEAEKQTGIQSRNKANQEAQSLRRWKKSLEEAGYEGDPEGIAEWLESKATPQDGDGSSDSKTNAEIAKLRREFEKQKKELEEERAGAQKIKAESDKRAIKSALQDALGKMSGHQYVIDSLILGGKVKLTEDEEVVFVDGENEVDFQSGVKGILESNPDLLPNTQAPGARSKTRPQQASPHFTSSQLKNMSAEEIAANMDNVLDSLKT
ncbi:MAG: hypothetical protein GF414_01530 [Candidatus Altiarchaeales archaeon]|nr:hypothetical protein [Candidatus Altiarchaeales archaeon]